MNQSAFFDRLDRYYINQSGPDIIVVGFSGGADSTALLRLSLAYAHTRGKAVHAVIVDHNLRRGSDSEAALCAHRAKLWGAIPTVLTWQHQGVNSQIQAKARAARYGLLGQYCRKLGSPILLTGHNRDDHAETILMRRSRDGSWRSRAGIGEISYAPLWPQLCRVTICRPLLSESRADIRTYCEKQGAEYVDDPSNENLKFDRIKARQALAIDPELRTSCLIEGDENRIRLEAEDFNTRRWIGDGGVDYSEPGALTFELEKRLDLRPSTLADMIMCAGGAEKRPDMAAVDALLAYIKTGRFHARTLGGAIIDHGLKSLLIMREPAGVLGRSDVQAVSIDLSPHKQKMWDRRFWVSANASEVRVAALWPSRNQLNKAARQKLKTFLPLVRQTQPGFYRGGELIAAPTVGFNLDTHIDCHAEPYLSWRLQPSPVGIDTEPLCN